MVEDLVAERLNVVLGNCAGNKGKVAKPKRSSQIRESAIPERN
jgi:hypothetical protein